jgi:ribosomal protein S27E/ribosomal protein L37E
MDYKFSLSLIDNSFDFLNSAIKYANGEENRDWKYALLNISNALELIMKAVLEKEHWSLLFENVDNANKEILSIGDFQSVNFKTAFERLKYIVGVDFSKNDEKYLKKIREKRNRITHFSAELHIEEVKSIVAKGIGVFIKLYKEIDTEENVEDKLHYINSELRGFQKYVKLRLAEIEKEIKDSQIPNSVFLTCPLCLQETIVIHEKYDELFCKFCGAEFSYEDMARYSSNGYGGPCPKCVNGALAFLKYNKDEEEYICTKCGFTSQWNFNFECSSCGNTYWDENGDENYLCEACHESIYE